MTNMITNMLFGARAGGGNPRARDLDPDERLRSPRLTLSTLLCKVAGAVHYDHSNFVNGLALVSGAVVLRHAATERGSLPLVCAGGLLIGAALSDWAAGLVLREKMVTTTPIGDEDVAYVGKPLTTGRQRRCKIAKHYAFAARVKYPRGTVHPTSAERMYIANRIARMVDDDRKELDCFANMRQDDVPPERIEARRLDLQHRIPITRDTREADLASVVDLATNLYFVVTVDDIANQQVAHSLENKQRVAVFDAYDEVRESL